MLHLLTNRKRMSGGLYFGPPGWSATAIEDLPERERLVLSLYYEQELNLKEIGAVLKVTESRVCQLHGQALVRLKAQLTEWVN